MNSIQTNIDFSLIETEVLGLKVGRCNSNLVDTDILYSQLIENEYDLCRLKVPAEDEMISSRLHKTGLPFYFSGSIRKYKTKITKNPPGEYNHDLSFEMYDGTQDALLLHMIEGTMGEYPIGYYRTPYLNKLITKKMEIECLFRFYKKYNLNADYPDNSLLFIKHGDKYVGFFSLNIINNNVESHIGGILSPYRKDGYFLDKLRYIQEFCVNNKLEHFVFGARNEYNPAQRIFQFVGFQPVGSDNVFHIPSLLSFSQEEQLKIFLQRKDTNSKDMFTLLYEEVMAVMQNKFIQYNNVKFNLIRAGNLNGIKEAEFQLSFPVIDTEQVLIVIKGLNELKEMTGYLYSYN